MDSQDWNQVVLPSGRGCCGRVTLHFLQPGDGWCVYVEETAADDGPAHHGYTPEYTPDPGDLDDDQNLVGGIGGMGPEPQHDMTGSTFSYYVQWGDVVVAQGGIPPARLDTGLGRTVVTCINDAKKLAEAIYNAVEPHFKGDPPDPRLRRFAIRPGMLAA